MAYPRAFLMLQLLLPAAYLHLMFSLHAAAALSFSYNFSRKGDLEAANPTYINDAKSSGDRVNLTAVNTNSSTGRVAYPLPVRLWDHRTGRRASFSTNFSFFIGNGSTSNSGNDRGDGMAFFVGPFPATMPGDSGGAFLGLFNNASDDPSPPLTVAVEFDTYKNTGLDPPDVTADHIGIDVDNISSANYTALPNMALSGVMSANIRYDGRSKMMFVSLWLENGSLYTVQARVDLKHAVRGPEAAIGFSAAATGDFVEPHQLLSWSFSSTDPSKNESWVIISIAIASASLVSLVAALLCSIMPRQTPAPPMERIVLPVAREFPFSDLSAATKNFSLDRWLGAGAFGEVYRGELLLEGKRSFVAKLFTAKCLRDPRMRPVAVKKLTTVINQTRRDYVSEIMTLGQLSHRNLVKLVGWCDGGEKPLLVYELVTNRSLDEHLHGSERLLTWPERYKIVLGVGAAIEYLHTGDQNPILHRDIKPSNVMLDDTYEAKLGDFGLVRQVSPGEASLRGTAMMGSWDYMDPQCIATGSATTASDMYSFGVLLLEIATGKRPRVLRSGSGEKVAAGLPNALVDGVRAAYGEGATVNEMADARLNGDFDKDQMERVLAVGLLCVQPDRRDRPGIRQAVYMLSNLRNPSPRVRFRLEGPANN